MSDVSLDGRAALLSRRRHVADGLDFRAGSRLAGVQAGLTETMKDAGGRGSTEGGRRQFVRGSLVVLEMASALLLLVGAGLLIKSFWAPAAVDPGFNPNNALTASVTLPSRKYPEENQQSAFFQQLLEKKALPGVQAAGASNVVPLGGDYVLGFVIEADRHFRQARAKAQITMR